MKKILYPITALAIAMLISTAAVAGTTPKSAVMYKPLQCGCCDDYAKYLEQEGIEVEIKSLPYSRLKNIKKMSGVSQRFEGCHTLLVDGYVVEGLVPMMTLNKLLTQRPDIKGISLPGMPVGAPGMPGRKRAPLRVYELSDGQPKIYAVE